MQPQQPGYNSSRVYLELLADLPWQKASKELELDLKAAKVRLDIDHYGLEKVKQRIIEYLAVRKVIIYLVLVFPGLYGALSLEVDAHGIQFLLCCSSNQMPEVLSCVLLAHQVSGKHPWLHLLQLL